jgi:DoxX-like family
MFVATVILSILLAAMLTFSAVSKLTRQQAIVESVDRVGFPRDKLDHLAVILLAGAAGLVLGLFWGPIGVAAAAGVVAYFVVTVAFHLRAGDAAHAPKPLLIGLLAAAALALRLATL